MRHLARRKLHCQHTMQEDSSEGAYLTGSNIHSAAAGPNAALLLQRVAVAAVTDLQNGRVKVRPFEGTQPARRARTGMRVLSATRPKACVYVFFPPS